MDQDQAVDAPLSDEVRERAHQRRLGRLMTHNALRPFIEWGVEEQVPLDVAATGDDLLHAEML
jgi:hypothetical protein